MALCCVPGRWHQPRHQLQLNRDAENILRQIVVDLTCNTIAFSENGAKLVGHAYYSHAIKLPCGQRKQDKNQREEPVGLIEPRLQIKRHRGAAFIPNAIVVCCYHAELVVARPQVCIRSYSPHAAVNPVVVKAFKFVFETHVFRCDKTQRRVVEIESGTTW